MSQSLKSVMLPDETATLAFGKQLAAQFKPPTVVFLEGELGVGKSTIVRGFLQGLGYSAIVKSPTFTLVETYEFKDRVVYHFDLYRLCDPEELEFMGIREYFDDRAIVFIEWPERGQGYLPKADVVLELGIMLPGRILKSLS